MALNGGFRYREKIDHQASGARLLDHLCAKYRHSDRATWRERLHRGQIFLDDCVVTSDCLLKSGQWLTWQRPPWKEPDVPLVYAVLHQDKDLLALAKPKGLPAVPGGGFLDHTLLALVRKSYPEATPMHRLGRGTSGVLLFARTAPARSALGRAFRNREVQRVYRALICGKPAEDHFTVDASIGPVHHPRLGTIHAFNPDGKYAKSLVRVLERREQDSLVEVTIETGRPHQIRVHMAFAGHPLVGDPLYTTGGRLAGKGTALPGDAGYLLHAESLSFAHPEGTTFLHIYCHPPMPLRSQVSPESEGRAGFGVLVSKKGARIM